jgi:hypothetical protein
MILPFPSDMHVGIICAFFSYTTGVVCHDTGYALPIHRGDIHSCGCADDEALETVAPADFEGNHGVWRLLKESVEFALGFEDSVTCVSVCSACTLDSNTLTRHHKASQWILVEIP